MTSDVIKFASSDGGALQAKHQAPTVIHPILLVRVLLLCESNIAYLAEGPKNEEQQARGWLTNDTGHLQSGLYLFVSQPLM